MPKICYAPRKFAVRSLKLIHKANEIIAAYQAQGYSLTLRQLYYQFVARDLLPNTMRSYKNLGSVINDARLAGLIDWDSIEDRTRELHEQPFWSSPSSIIQVCADTFTIDKWADQDFRVEVWIEKEALAGVFQRVCDELQVPFFSCRGYTSQSEMWAAGRRLMRHARNGQDVKVIHFGDHDPSGMDMTRDIKDRLKLFSDDAVVVTRLALNMDQIEDYEPPPNPAKTTDSRYAEYITVYGDESWELDALEPDVLAGLVRDFVTGIRDDERWQAALELEAEHRRLLTAVSDDWDNITEGL